MVFHTHPPDPFSRADLSPYTDFFVSKIHLMQLHNFKNSSLFQSCLIKIWQCFKKNVKFCLFYNMYRFLIQNHLYNVANVVNVWLCLSLINVMADFLAVCVGWCFWKLNRRNIWWQHQCWKSTVCTGMGCFQQSWLFSLKSIVDIYSTLKIHEFSQHWLKAVGFQQQLYGNPVKLAQRSKVTAVT